jgi:hypothetical protein
MAFLTNWTTGQDGLKSWVRVTSSPLGKVCGRMSPDPHAILGFNSAGARRDPQGFPTPF